MTRPDVPDWIAALDAACRRESQKRVAERIGYSAAVINQVLKGKYGRENGGNGDLAAVEKAVRGALLHATVDCPVCGELPANKCLEYQRLPFAATNPQRVQLYRACRSGCPHSRREDTTK